MAWRCPGRRCLLFGADVIGVDLASKVPGTARTQRERHPHAHAHIQQRRSHVHARTCTHTHAHARTRTYTHRHTHVGAHATSTRAHMCTRVQVDASVRACTCARTVDCLSLVGRKEAIPGQGQEEGPGDDVEGRTTPYTLTRSTPPAPTRARTHTARYLEPNRAILTEQSM